MSAPSTRQMLLSQVEDVEIITKELFEVMCTPKSQRPEGIDTTQLINLLVQKDKEIQETLKIAQEQGETQKKYDALKAQVDLRDQDVRQLQKNLKEAETKLSSAIYQAKQKLKAINQANKRKISSEELIKYAHKISASNAVAAPPTWSQGDQRRPYPTDIDMRCGLLGRLSDLPINNQALQSQTSLSESLATGRSSMATEHHLQASQSSSMSWQPSHDLGSSTMGQGHHGMSHKDNEVEEMNSSDSSSSSSSDE